MQISYAYNLAQTRVKEYCIIQSKSELNMHDKQ
jgi:hypothetical protein